MPRSDNNVLVIDTARLSGRLLEAALHDPLVYRLVWLLQHGEGFDATELISDAIVMQSKSNRDLLQKCIKLNMAMPAAVPFQQRSEG